MYIVMIMTKEGTTKIVNFMTTGQEFLLEPGRISYTVRMHYFFKNLLFYFWAWFRQTNSKFHDPQGRGANVLRSGHTSHGEIALFLWEFSSLHPGIDQTNWEYSNNDQGRVYLNYKLIDPRGKGCCAGAWPYSENAIFPLLFLLFLCT